MKNIFNKSIKYVKTIFYFLVGGNFKKNKTDDKQVVVDNSNTFDNSNTNTEKIFIQPNRLWERLFGWVQEKIKDKKTLKRNYMYNCFDIAWQFLDLAKKENISIDPMKLLKLTYIANGYYLGFNGKPLFENNIEAWKYGPVIPDLYRIIKRYGKGSVRIDTVDLYIENKILSSDLKFLKLVWDKFKRYSGLELSALTHEENTPWSETYTEENMNKIIKTTDIQTYYEKLIKA